MGCKCRNSFAAFLPGAVKKKESGKPEKEMLKKLKENSTQKESK